jgi:hypothetical protein
MRSETYPLWTHGKPADKLSVFKLLGAPESGHFQVEPTFYGCKKGNETEGRHKHNNPNDHQAENAGLI